MIVALSTAGVRATYVRAKDAAIRTAKTAAFQASTFRPSSTETGSMLKAAIIALIWNPERPMAPKSEAGAARKATRKTSESARLVMVRLPR